MRRIYNVVALALVASVTFVACSDQSEVAPDLTVPDNVLAKMIDLGFDVDNQAPTKLEDGYLVEGDIFLTDQTIAEMSRAQVLPTVEQYSTNNLVSGNRVITMYIPTGTTDGGGSPGGGKGKKNKNEMADAKGGKPGSGGGGGTTFSATEAAALDEVVSRYNAEGLNITFSRATSATGADIVFTRLSSYDEGRGVLGSAGFPTSQGDPYGEIKMSGILESSYGLSVNGIATIMAHEVGHCIGFRHTDYFDRSVSCGGSTANEGDGGVGANHIPGTPTGASAQANSWMLACTDGSNRNFNNDDKTALSYLY